MLRLKILYLLIPINLLGIQISSFAVDDFMEIKDKEAFEKKMKVKTAQTETISGSFRQEKYLSFMSEKVTSKGIFYYKKSDKLRWEYITPFEYLIIMNGNKMIVKDSDSENKFDVQSNRLFREINVIMLSAVTGDLLSDDSKFKSSYYENKDYYLVKMKPASKSVAEFLKSIHLYLNKKSLVIAKLRMVEPSDDYTDIIFETTQFNKVIADEKFNSP